MMLDKDVLMLQIAASMLDPNEFLIHLMHKFGLDQLLEELSKPASELGSHSDTLHQ